MADLGCQDTDWVDENDKETLDVISLQDGHFGYLGCISGWFGALREAPRVTDG